MPSYLVETYLARGQAGERAARERRARSAAGQLLLESVRFERSIYVPEDGICFFVFDAPIRVVEAVSSRGEEEK